MHQVKVHEYHAYLWGMAILHARILAEKVFSMERVMSGEKVKMQPFSEKMSMNDSQNST